MSTELHVDAAGQTIGPDGKLKDMTGDQLKKTQEARRASSGIAIKEGGSLTMPKRWRGSVPDSNSSWGDWTNYSFPLHDLAHANNAMARLAQSQSYTDAEKSKIKGRIEVAQKKYGAKKFVKGAMLELEDMVLVSDAKDFLEETPSKDMGAPDEMEGTYSKKEVHQMMSNMMDHMYGMYNNLYANIYGAINEVYAVSKHRDQQIIDGVNGCMVEHGDGHMPKLLPHHITAILKAAKIHNEFEKKKHTMDAPTHNPLYASLSLEDKATLDSIKFKVE